MPTSDLKMASVGDVALGNHPKTPGFGFFSSYRDGIPAELAARATPSSLSFDSLFGNLEFALTADDSPLDTDNCCIGHVGYADFLRRTRLTVLNMLNNHAWQRGRAVHIETVQVLREAGIKVVGIPDDYDRAQ